MNKKKAFTDIVDYVFDDLSVFEDVFPTDILNAAKEFWEDFKNENIKKKANEMTENGRKLLSWMQENVDTMSNIFTSKEAAEALFTSGRSIAGSMRKLVNDEYVEKIGKDPVQYSLTDKGKNYQFDI